MKLELRITIAPPPEAEKLPSYVQRLVQELNSQFTLLTNLLTGQLTFGDGTTFDNIAGTWVTYTTNAVANTEDTVAHNLGSVPSGFLVMVPPKNGFLYNGGTAWSSTNLFLKCSQADQTVTIFVLTKPIQDV